MDNITPAIQTYSILAAAMAAGANLATSIITFPALCHAMGQTRVTQWKILYDSGSVSVVSTALTSALGFATLAYRTTLAPALAPTGDISHGKRNLYAATAVAMFGLVPYTRILMLGTIDERSRRATEGKAAGEKADSRALVERWGALNFWRGVMMVTGTGLAVWASVSKWSSRKGCWREEMLHHAARFRFLNHPDRHLLSVRNVSTSRPDSFNTSITHHGPNYQYYFPPCFHMFRIRDEALAAF